MDYRDKVKKMYYGSPCSSCKMASYCPGCPVHLILENGEVTKCNNYFKKVTELKLSKI